MRLMQIKSIQEMRKSKNGKIYDVFIPDLGADKDVDLIDVMIKVGDIVDVEDGLITLETEKASMDVPTPYKKDC